MNHSEVSDKTTLGFWVYLMTDLLTFGVLFATYAVLKGNIASGPSAQELFSLPFVLTETLILLTSSFTAGMAMLAVHHLKKNQVFAWLSITFLLGISFLAMEVWEFNNLIAEGHSWRTSAFLSSFFTLVGTHGLHIAVGLLWMIVSVVMVWSRGLTPFVSSKLARLGLFWHFLDIVWIFIFTFVYLYAHV